MSDQQDECVHLMPPGQCSICKTGPTAKNWVKVSHPFRAQLPGQCSGCNLPIVPDQLLMRWERRTRDGYTYDYLHEECSPVGY